MSDSLLLQIINRLVCSIFFLYLFCYFFPKFSMSLLYSTYTILSCGDFGFQICPIHEVVVIDRWLPYPLESCVGRACRSPAAFCGKWICYFTRQQNTFVCPHDRWVWFPRIKTKHLNSWRHPTISSIATLIKQIDWLGERFLVGCSVVWENRLSQHHGAKQAFKTSRAAQS